MQSEKLNIEGLVLVTPDVFGDARGFFFESYNYDKFRGIGIDTVFVQDNHSASVKDTLRGLHFQTAPGQAKLLRVLRGNIWDVAVDMRPGSPTLGKWVGVELSEENRKMFYIPVGFAHGFCVLSDYAEVAYKCSSVYNKDTETGVAWDDPDIAVAWPVKTPVLSERDKTNQSFKAYLAKAGVK